MVCECLGRRQGAEQRAPLGASRGRAENNNGPQAAGCRLEAAGGCEGAALLAAAEAACRRARAEREIPRAIDRRVWVSSVMKGHIHVLDVAPIHHEAAGARGAKGATTGGESRRSTAGGAARGRRSARARARTRRRRRHRSSPSSWLSVRCCPTAPSGHGGQGKAVDDRVVRLVVERVGAQDGREERDWRERQVVPVAGDANDAVCVAVLRALKGRGRVREVLSSRAAAGAGR